MKPIFSLTAFAAVTALAACDAPVFANDPTSTENPAATFCEAQGHSYEIRDGANGQVGVCVFASGGEKDAWQYFRENATGANPSAAELTEMPPSGT